MQYLYRTDLYLYLYLSAVTHPLPSGGTPSLSSCGTHHVSPPLLYHAPRRPSPRVSCHTTPPIPLSFTQARHRGPAPRHRGWLQPRLSIYIHAVSIYRTATSVSIDLALALYLAG